MEKKTAEEKERIAYEIARKIIAIPDNKPEHAADHKLMNTTTVVQNAMIMAERQALSEFKGKLRSRIIFWNSTTTDEVPKYSYKDFLELIDSL